MKVPLIIKEAEEGRRRVKFVERVKSGDQEDDFEEHSLSHIYTLTLNEVAATGRQRGRVVSALDSKSLGPRFESASGHLLDSVLGLPEFKSSATLVNSQPVASRQLGFLILLC